MGLEPGAEMSMVRGQNPNTTGSSLISQTSSLLPLSATHTSPIFFTQPPAILASRSNEILTAVVQGARKEEPSAEVQTAAIQALLNSLEFIRDNFDREVGLARRS